MYMLFPKVNEMRLFWLSRSDTCVFAYMRSNTTFSFFRSFFLFFYFEETFYPHCLISESGFSLNGKLSDGWFWISGHSTHTETDSLLMVDSSLLTITSIEKRDPPPPLHKCTYLIPQLEERTFETSRSHSHRFVMEGNQNPRQEEEIPEP